MVTGEPEGPVRNRGAGAVADAANPAVVGAITLCVWLKPTNAVPALIHSDLLILYRPFGRNTELNRFKHSCKAAVSSVEPSPVALQSSTASATSARSNEGNLFTQHTIVCQERPSYSILRTDEAAIVISKRTSPHPIARASPPCPARQAKPRHGSHCRSMLWCDALRPPTYRPRPSR